MKRLRTSALQGLTEMIRLANDSLSYLRAHGATKEKMKDLTAGRDYAEELIRRHNARVARRAAK